MAKVGWNLGPFRPRWCGSWIGAASIETPSTNAHRGREGSTMLLVFKVKQEISDNCRPKERDNAAFTFKQWKRSI